MKIYQKTALALVSALVLFSSVSMVFAATTASAIVPDMNFVGPEIKLSLDQAVNLTLTSSSGIETAKITLKSNQAKTEDYYQTASNLSQLDKDADAGKQVNTASRTYKEMARLAASFATAQSQKNYDADVNALKRSAVKQYFETLQAKDAARIALDNVTAQEAILKNTNAKFKLGMVAKKEVLAAEVSLNQAKLELQTAQNAYSLTLMNFNQYFGYPVMQKITLTDTLKVTDPTLTPLADAIGLALANRNEIAGANFQFNYQTLNLKETGNNYSKSSARYLTAQASLMSAEKGAKDAPAQVEIDVRSKYLSVQAAKSSVNLGKLSVEKSKESARLAKLSYDVGMVTLVDVQQAQLAAVQSELQYSKYILVYQLAIIDYEQSLTAGTNSVKF